jgi:regulator of RNase E activity RraA
LLEEHVGRFAELPGPAMVVFQDLDDPAMAATFGEVMCSTYKAFGASGIVTSGAARDLEQVSRLGFPAFSDGAICSHGYSHIVELHGAVRVGGIAIHTGDLIHADWNGVTTIPVEIASDVADAAVELAAAESLVLDCLRSGKVGVTELREARREMMERLEGLGRRLRSKTKNAG